jgi:hypothetical protein
LPGTEARQRLFAGSVIDRRLLVREGETGARCPWPNRLAASSAWRWTRHDACSGLPAPASIRYWRRPACFQGLVAIDLDRLEEARRIAVPGAQLGDVAIAGDGTVYASDGQSGAIYRCRPGCQSAEQLIPPGIFESPQGMVVTRHGSRLYVADYVRGLYRIELGSLHVVPMIVRQPTMLDGIDGLVSAGQILIAVQNGVRPHRIIRIYLNDDGRIVESVNVAEQNAASWGEPTLGALSGYRFLFVADAQWERYGAGGALIGGGAPRPTSIRQIEALPSILITGR